MSSQRDGSVVIYGSHAKGISVEGKESFGASLDEALDIKLNEETVIRLIAVDEEKRMDIELSDFYEPEKLKDLDLVLAVTVTFMDKRLED